MSTGIVVAAVAITLLGAAICAAMQHKVERDAYRVAMAACLVTSQATAIDDLDARVFNLGGGYTTAPAMPERFTAWAMCPRCKFVDCHLMREPKRFDPTIANIAVTPDVVRFMAWGGKVIHEVEVAPYPHDESMYEVIRICKCGSEWGQL